MLVVHYRVIIEVVLLLDISPDVGREGGMEGGVNLNKRNVDKTVRGGLQLRNAANDGGYLATLGEVDEGTDLRWVPLFNERQI